MGAVRAVAVPAVATLLAAETDPLRLAVDVLGSPWLNWAMYFGAISGLGLWVALAYWVYNDAERRGVSGLGWIVVAVCLPFVGAAIYLLARPPEYEVDRRERELQQAVFEQELKEKIELCPGCRGVVERDHAYCAGCGTALKNTCHGCEAPLRPSWSNCPFCGLAQQAGSPRARKARR